MQRLSTIILISLINLSCDSPVATKNKASVDGTTEDGDIGLAPITMVSAFRLDDPDFKPVGVSVALQQFAKSQVPLVTFTMPKPADHVRIIRCLSNAVINTGPNMVALDQIDIMGVNGFAADIMFRANDFFSSATNTQGCEMVTSFLNENSILDPFAPDGSFYYLVQACLHPVRLLDREKLSNRNCSRQIAVSPKLSDYINQNTNALRDATKMKAYYTSQATGLSSLMRSRAEIFNKELQLCEEREHRRLVSVAKRKAIATVVAATFETAIAIGSYAEAPNMLARIFIVQGLAGVMLSPSFIEISSQSTDYPRSCDEAEKADRQLATVAKDLETAFVYAAHFKIVVDQYTTGMTIFTGKPGPVPDYEDPFQDPRYAQ